MIQTNYMNLDAQNNRNLELKFETLTRKLNLKTKYETEKKSEIKLNLNLKTEFKPNLTAKIYLKYLKLELEPLQWRPLPCFIPDLLRLSTL